MYQELDYDSDNSSCFESNGEHEGKVSQDESRYIIHLDVDCFYCQCEEIANPSLATRPVAIGQKHIIVTSNYVAREMGVKKLQSRDDAMRACPSLLIIEGSDIEPYRDASRSIYDAFRSAVKDLHSENSTRKGGMDEYFADITSAVEEEWEKDEIDRRYLCTTQNDIWVYGDDADSCVVQITEDQSGATATSAWKQKKAGGQIFDRGRETDVHVQTTNRSFDGKANTTKSQSTNKLLDNSRNFRFSHACENCIRSKETQFVQYPFSLEIQHYHRYHAAPTNTRSWVENLAINHSNIEGI